MSREGHLPPAILSPLYDPDFPVSLSLDGVRRCRIALEKAAHDAAAVNGWRRPSNPFQELLAVLKVAELEAAARAAGQPVGGGVPFRVVMPAPRPEDGGSAGGSAVAAAEEDGPRSAVEVPGDLGTRAAARRLGISSRMVRRAASKGWLTATRGRGGAWSIDAAAVAAYGERQQQRRSRHGGHDDEEGGPASPPG